MSLSDARDHSGRERSWQLWTETVPTLARFEQAREVARLHSATTRDPARVIGLILPNLSP